MDVDEPVHKTGRKAGREQAKIILKHFYPGLAKTMHCIETRCYCLLLSVPSLSSFLS